jgi:hypothetical protein
VETWKLAVRLLLSRKNWCRKEEDMERIRECRLPCGCLVLVDQDGPVSCLEPCPRYPDVARKVTPLESAQGWEDRLRRYRLKERQRRQRHREP